MNLNILTNDICKTYAVSLCYEKKGYESEKTEHNTFCKWF